MNIAERPAATDTLPCCRQGHAVRSADRASSDLLTESVRSPASQLINAEIIADATKENKFAEAGRIEAFPALRGPFEFLRVFNASLWNAAFPMCGRYTDTKRDKQFLVRMGIEQAEIDFVPRYNLAPTQTASIVACQEDGRPELRRSRWGLIPFWAKDEKIGSSLINARAEDIATKPAFRTSFRKKRCVVLADGFFEWQKVPRGKQPVYIHFQSSEPFVFGGLWDRWHGLETFSIITVEPNELLSSVHNRMPLILPPENIQCWLDPKTSSEELTSLLRPYPARQMEFFPVSPQVNTPRIDSSELIERIVPGPLTLEPISRRKTKIVAEEPLLPGF